MPKAVSLASLLALPLVAAAFTACSSTPAADARVSSQTYLADVAWLADDARQGRDTDSPELRQTADWVAEHFDEAGLEPLGDDGGWLQHFTVKGQRRLLDGNTLRLGDEALELRREWIPLQTAMSAEVEGDVVFAGYGISDPDGGYDDYAGLDVKDKLVLVLRRGPNSGVEGSRYSQNGPGGSHISFATKVNAAFRHGAQALLVVNGPFDFEPGTRADRPMRYGSLGADTTASLPAAQLSAQSALAILSAHGLDLAAAQKALDESLKPQSRPLAGLSAALTIAAEEEQIET
ncbi:MAG TPA: PA domain-containing protein, partial [Planctomycetota bacterium]|nr:PA domain-containing protein [Planctomycetota bacterium]